MLFYMAVIWKQLDLLCLTSLNLKFPFSACVVIKAVTVILLTRGPEEKRRGRSVVL